MASRFLILIFSLGALVSAGKPSDSSELNVTCNFGFNTKLQDLPALYCCKVISLLQITSRAFRIVSAVSSHTNFKSDTSVECFNIDGRELIGNQRTLVKFLPAGIDGVFAGLKHLRVGDANLKEITQEDLKPFTLLTALSLFYNDIEVLERDLFTHNPHLEFIWLEKNRIKQIYPSVFDRLASLENLCLLNNACISTQAINSRDGVERVIDELKASRDCIDDEYARDHYPELYEETLRLRRLHAIYVKAALGLVVVFLAVALIGTLAYWWKKRRATFRRELPPVPKYDGAGFSYRESDMRYSVSTQNPDQVYYTLSGRYEK